MLVRPAMLAVLAAALAVGPGVRAASAVPAGVVTVRATSGQTYDGTIAAPGDLHAFFLEDFAPMLVSISLKTAKGSLLQPDIALYDPSEVETTSLMDVVRKNTAKSVTVKNTDALSFGLTGRYVLLVSGLNNSTGKYLLKVTAKVAKKFSGTGTVGVGDTDLFSFFAPTDSLATLKVVKSTGSILEPIYLGASGPPCASSTVIPGTKVGSATLPISLTGDWTVEVDGSGGTAGAFKWTAKVKPAKRSKIPVRVNGGPSYIAPLGTTGGIRTTAPGQDLYGFDADATDLCWREVRSMGGGPNLGKNSIQCSGLTGAGRPGLANNFASDPNPPGGFALGRTHGAVFAGGSLWGIPRSGGNEVELNDTLGGAVRLLADEAYAYHLRADGIRRYAFDESVSEGVSTDGAYTYLDMAFGGDGVVFAAANGGDLLIATVSKGGGTVTPIVTFSPNPGLQGFAARGTDVYVAVDNGDGGTKTYRASACFPGNALPLGPDFDEPVRSLAADDQNVYAIVDNAAEGPQLAQIPRGGGEATVILRSDVNGSGFEILDDHIAVAGGYAFVAADDGAVAFYRVKRR